MGKGSNEKEVFIDHLTYGREQPETKVSSKTRNFISWLANLFGSSDTSNSELTNYEVLQVSEGYHQIFQEVFLADSSKYYYV